MNGVWQKLISVGVAATLGVASAGCGQRLASADGNAKRMASVGAASSRPRVGGAIALDIRSIKLNLDPVTAFDPISNEIVCQMYDQLVTYDHDTYHIVPMAASSWQVSRDGRTYIFHLRRDMRFWNGDPVTAQSFVNELRRILNRKLKPQPCPAPSFFFDIRGAAEYYSGSAKTIRGVTTPDAHTLVFHLMKPEDNFLQILALPFLSAVDVKADKKRGLTEVGDVPMGSGPFRLVKETGQQLVLQRNPHYWRKDRWGNRLPYLDRITFHRTGHKQLPVIDFEQGQTALLSPSLTGDSGIPNDAWTRIQRNWNGPTQSLTRTDNTVWYLGMNVTQKPFTDRRVRQAVEYAIDKAKLAKLNGDMMPADQPLPPTLPGHVTHLKVDYTYNPEKARQLLRKAGYKDGDRIVLWAPTETDQDKVVQAIQSMLQTIGMKVTWKRVSFQAYLRTMTAGKAPLFYAGWRQDFPDASDFLQLFDSANPPALNPSEYRNRQVHQWLQQAQSTQDENQRLDLYAKVTEQVMKDAVWVPVGYPIHRYAVQSWLHGFYTSPVKPDPLAEVWVDSGHVQAN
jgi:oligopeptide transport system substrate-binding protein